MGNRLHRRKSPFYPVIFVLVMAMGLAGWWVFKGAPFGLSQVSAEEAGESDFGGFDFDFGDLLGELESTVEEEAAPEEPAIPSPYPGVEPGYEQMAENEHLVLYMNKEDSNFVVRDKRNDMLWRSKPDLTGSGIEIGGLWERNLQSVFTFEYTDAERKRKRNGDPIKMAEEKEYTPIENGVKVTYKMPEVGMTLALEFRLDGDALDARMPEAEYKETGDNKLVTLQILPFFGAQLPTAQGYMFYPDGSGAIARFRENHPEYTEWFNESIYGPNHDDKYFDPVQTSQRVRLPIFGVKAGENAAFLGIVTQGEYDAKITYAPAGYIVNINRTASQFIFRQEYDTNLRRGVTVETIAAKQIPGDRAVRYQFLTGKEANYTGMAAAYRRYLIEKQGIKKTAGLQGKMPLNLRFFMGVEKQTLLMKKMVVMTNYDQVIEILKDLKAAGVEHMEVTLEGWNRHGYAGSYPKRLAPDGRLGGVAGMRRLMDYAKANETTVYLQDNYVDAYAGNGGFSARRDVVREPNRLPFQGWIPEKDTTAYIMNADVAYERFAKKDLPQMAAWGATGVELESMGEVLFSDAEERHPMTREQFAGAWKQILQLGKEKFERVAVVGGNAWTLGLVDKVVNMPLQDSGYFYTDESVPFYQLAMHGLLPYTTDQVGNQRYDPRRQFLKEVEVGALPVFELTKAPAGELKDTTYNKLYSSEYQIWKEHIVKEYKEVQEKLGHTWTLSITGHEEVAPKVFKTTYEDGTEVVVNYNETPYVQGALQVSGLDYAVLAPGRGAK